MTDGPIMEAAYMMNWIWCILFCVGTIFVTLFQGGDAALTAMMDGAQGAVTLCISLAGSYILWMGLLGVARQAGLIDALSRKLKRPCEWLFPGAGEATGPIALNIAANMLGMGNAATPFGLDAMRVMQKNNKVKTRATTAMCVFLAVNASALQLIPTTMIGLRAAEGSSQPGAIVVPTLLSSAIATLVAIILCRILGRKA